MRPMELVAFRMDIDGKDERHPLLIRNEARWLNVTTLD